MPMKFVSQKSHISGNDIHFEHYNTSPSAPTLVMLHGFLSSGFCYRTLIPYLSEDYNIISLDLPPFGQSGKSRHFKYSYENLAALVVQFLRKMKINTCTLIGHSMGGQICLYIMKNYPEFVNNAVLLCSSGYLPKSGRILRIASYIPYFPQVVKRRLEKEGVEKTLENVVFNKGLIDDEMRDGYLRPFFNDDIFRALSRMIRDREGDLSAEDLQRINTRCLLIWGRYDRVVPLQIGEQLKKDLPRAELVVIEDAGHLIPEEKPEEVAELIMEFMKKEKTQTV
jgi:pimeloyl-ACP methyl ester carboxylesterase